ncbi:hypothetical protein OG828_48600 [Streptomyces sp. NBC_00457]|uniref:hypothetical protein n=1 Tax=Streptomyces sp. NBC_00457 TaxID=2975748 RepID=UPI002E1C6298
MNLLHRNIGQLTIAAGVIDDVVGWLLLSIVSAMATTGVSGWTVASSVGLLALAVPVAGHAGSPASDWASVLRPGTTGGQGRPTAQARSASQHTEKWRKFRGGGHLGRI